MFAAGIDGFQKYLLGIFDVRYQVGVIADIDNHNALVGMPLDVLVAQNHDQFIFHHRVRADQEKNAMLPGKGNSARLSY